MDFLGLTNEMMTDFNHKTGEMIIVKLRAIKGLVEDKELREILSSYDFFSLDVSKEAEAIKAMIKELEINGYALEIVRPEQPAVKANYDKENMKLSMTSPAPVIKITKTVIEF